MSRFTSPQPLQAMDPSPAVIARIVEPVIIRRPAERLSPLLVASPHSGRTYPPDLLSQSALPLDQLRRSEDAYVDILIETAPELGITSILAPFPRVFIDPNRSTAELDPVLFADLPAQSVGASPHVQAGLGIIPRISAGGRNLYHGPLAEAEARRRIADYYRPYHGAIDAELKAACDIFGKAILLDFHSMPAIAAGGVDIVLGDRHGNACDAGVTVKVETAFRNQGFRVRRNQPYAGGYTTVCYGDPGRNRHAIQIEINRGLYLEEETVTRSGTFPAAREKIESVLRSLVQETWS